MKRDFWNSLIKRVVTSWKIRSRSKAFRLMFYSLGTILVFLTTYMMILPAITIDRDAAGREPGMNITMQSQRNNDTTGTSGGDSLSSTGGLAEETTGYNLHPSMEEGTGFEMFPFGMGNNGVEGNTQIGLPTEEDRDGVNSDSQEATDGTSVDTSTDQTENTEEIEEIEGPDSKDTDPDVNQGSDAEQNTDTDQGSDTEQNTDTDREKSGEDGSSEKVKEEETPGSASDALITEPITLTWEGDDYIISAYIDEFTMLPEGTSLKVKEIRKNVKKEKKDYQGYFEKALEEINRIDGNETDGTGPQEELTFARFFDISFVKDGKELEPAAPVDVTITLDQSKKRNAVEGADAADLKKKENIRVVHFDETKKKTKVEEVFNESIRHKKKENIDVQFTGESFSVYGVVYTVDFHWEVDGKTYAFSIPGGGFVSFYELIKTLGIVADDADTENDEMRELLDSVESISFSNPELVSVSKVEEDTTVGAIKDRLGLACEYSSDLTEEQIAEINAQDVKTGDWALIAVKPFDTEENLTVTMKNGDQWTVKVTDAWNDTYGVHSVQVKVSDEAAGQVGIPLWGSGSYGKEVWPYTSGLIERLGGGTIALTIDAVANPGYVFDHWELNGNVYTNDHIITEADGSQSTIPSLTVFIGNHDGYTMTAVFSVENNTTLSISSGEGGRVSAESSPVNRGGYNVNAIIASANDGYWFDHWELDGNPISEAEGISVAGDGTGSQINAGALSVGEGNDHELHAVFVPETRFNVVASEGGAVDVNSSARTKDGYNKTRITATAEAGYWFDHWEVDGEIVKGNVQAETDGSRCVVPVKGICVSEGKTLKAVFIPEVKYTVTATSEEGGIATGCTVKVGNGTAGATIESNDMNRAGYNIETITATAGPGFVFKEWQLDGTPILGGASITTASDGSSSTIDAGTLQIGTEVGHKVTAVFAQEYTFTVSTSPKGAGTVKDDGKTSGETIFGSMTKDGHNKYEITATAKNGYKFSHWTMNGQVLKDGAGNELYTNGTIPEGALTLTSSDNICAVFVKNTYTITVTNGGNGWTNVSTMQTESNAEAEKKASNTIIAYPNNGYKFAYWKINDSDTIVDWGNGYSATSSTIQPTVNRDVTVTAVFVPDSYRTFTVTVDDPRHGTVFGKDANRNDVAADGVSTYVARTRGSGSDNNDQRIQVQTTFGGYEFVGWELVRPNGKVYQSYKNNNKLAGWRIDANSLNIPSDNMTLRAIFKEREVVPFDDPTMDDLIDWANGIADTDFTTDKTAEVFDYDNRIYKISMSASSKKRAIDSSVVINFITDVSRSMYFPANIEEVGDYGNSNGNTTGADLQKWLSGKSTDQVYYIILSQNKTATMYAVYHDGNQWRFVDASYYAPNSDDGLTMSGDPVSGVKPATGDNYKIYQAPPRKAGKPWSRLDYLCMSVEAAADVIYTICPNAQIDLTTFNRSARYMGTLPTDHAGIEAMLRDIDVSGGTRQDLGLEKALPHFTNDSSKKQVAVLITDGAPNPPDGNMTKIWQDINIFAGQMKDITDADGDHLELYTMGLSLKNVGDNEAKLNAVATEDPDKIGVYPNKYAKSVNSGQETSEAVKEIVNSLLNDVSLFGSMTDTIDPAFYPVDVNGQPIQEGYYAANGSILNSVPTDNTPYYEWVNNDGTWTITWYSQTFAWADEENPGWKTNFYVKAKEDFLGGNKISTNKGSSNGLTATGYVKTDTSITPLTSDVTKTFDYTPYVNVDELHMNGNRTEWTVYLGTNVNPKAQLKKLFESIPVKQVVKEGGTTEDIYITAANQMYYEHGTAVNNEDEEAPTENYQTLPLSHFLTYGVSTSTNKNLGGVFDDLLEALKNNDSASLEDIVYTEYGHPAGYFTVTLTKDVNNEANAEHAPELHATKKPGEGIEKYTVKVTYTPYTTTVPANDSYDHTTSGGTSGHITTGSGNDKVESNNTHKINVYSKPLDIMKVNEQGMPILAPKQAKFELLKAWSTGDSNTNKVTFGITPGYSGYKLSGESLDGRTYTVVDQQVTDDNGIAHFGVDALLSGGEYILIEKEEPDGYEKDLNAKTISIETDDTNLNFYSNLDLEPFAATMPYNWNQGVRFVLKENDGETSSETVLEYVDDNGRKIKLYTPGLEETDENLRDFVFSNIDNDMNMTMDPVGVFRTRFLNVVGAIDVTFKKVGVNNTDQAGTKTNLGGAKFTLYDATGTNKDTKGSVVVIDNEAFQDKISDEATGVFWTGMLPVGDYLLEEAEAPAGYTKIGVLIKVTVTEDGVSLGYVGTVGTPPYNEPTKEGDTWTITTINTAGVALPAAGGPGTTLIYILGTMLTGLAGAGLVMKRRRKNAA